MKKSMLLLCAIAFCMVRAQNEEADLYTLPDEPELTNAIEIDDVMMQVEDEEEMPEQEVSEEEDISGLEAELDRAFSQEMEKLAAEDLEGVDEDALPAEDDDIVTGFLKKDEPSKLDTAAPLLVSDELLFDIEKKTKDVKELVERAKKELQDRPLDVACNRFTHTKEFIKGDLYVFVYDINGTCLAHGEDAHLLWQNLYNLTDWVGTPIVQDIIKIAKAGGGWVTYGWYNATKVSYVQLVEKEGKPYVIGSGFFPHSKQEAVVNLVKGGVALFNKVKKDGKPADWAFSRLSYPSGAFVAGNLYLYALDFEGNIMA